MFLVLNLLLPYDCAFLLGFASHDDWCKWCSVSFVKELSWHCQRSCMDGEYGACVLFILTLTLNVPPVKRAKHFLKLDRREQCLVSHVACDLGCNYLWVIFAIVHFIWWLSFFSFYDGKAVREYLFLKVLCHSKWRTHSTLFCSQIRSVFFFFLVVVFHIWCSTF